MTIVVQVSGLTALEYFRLFAPEFVTTPDEVVEAWLDIASSLVNVSCLDDNRANMAIALYAAHLLSLSSSSAGGSSTTTGPLTMEKEGDLQRSYGAVKGSDTYLGQTTYGQQYLNITNACFGSAIMTRGPSSGCC